MKTTQSDLSHKTIFVQGIPHDCSNEQLIEVFSTQGPVKSGFIVKRKSDEKPDPTKSLVGFITYHDHEDAKSVSEASNGKFSVNGCKLKAQFSRRKPNSKDNKKSNESTTATAITSTPQANQKLSALSKLWQNKCDIDQNNPIKGSHCLVATHSGSILSVKEFQKVWTEKKLKTPLKLLVESNQQTFYIIMPSKQDCLKAVIKLNNCIIGTKPVKIFMLVDPSSKEFEKSAKKSRLIVRNLSFNCTEKDLAEAFDQYGLLTECKIPTTSSGKKRGYGFIQYTHPFESERAIKGMNMKQIKGRCVAVDWTIPRKKYKDTVENEEEDKEEEDATQEEVEEDDDVDEEDLEKTVEEDSGLESEEDEDEEEDEEEETKEVKKKDKNFSSDVHEEKTIFLRNLSYDVKEDELEEFVKQFGEIKYCKLVENPNTGMSKGTAFVQFIAKGDADKCLTRLNSDDENLTLRGRRFVAVIAIDRAKSKQIRNEKQAEKKADESRRNLHLATEGIIRPGTLAANGLSEIELNKRRKIEEKKRQKLKKPEVFVSPLRLCIHNLPRACTDAKLKEIFLKAAAGSDLKPRIVESRIMRNREDVNHEGIARSLGFGYVRFTHHQHALNALRALNNNPDVFSSQKRPIVEFALENRKALEAQKMRQKRQKAKIALKQKMSVEGAEGSKVSKKKARRLERRAKARLERGDKSNEKSNEALLLPLDGGFVPKGEEKTKIEVKKIKKLEVGGEKKDYEGSRGYAVDGKKMKTMKHFGAKIRKRDKGKILERLRESKKRNKEERGANKEMKKSLSRKERKEISQMSGTSTRKRKRSSVEDMKDDKEFNSLVQYYAKKFRSNLTSA